MEETQYETNDRHLCRGAVPDHGTGPGSYGSRSGRHTAGSLLSQRNYPQ